MRDPYGKNQDDLDELLQQVDDLLVSSDDNSPYDDRYDDYDGYDDDGGYGPEGIGDMDDTMVFQNFSNHYGADVQNFANGYGRQRPPEPQPAPPVQNIPAYNADFRQQPRRDSAPKRSRPAPRPQQSYAYEEPDPIPDYYDSPKPKKHRRHRRRGCGCGCSTVIMVFAILIGAMFFLIRPPKSDVSIGDRKRDTATILLCGVDADGTRTDTMMLMYLSGSENKVGLLSIPRDTYILTTGGNEVKLNAAYSLNNKGQEGMEGLFDHIQKIIGYRPDGYILVDFELVPQITDLMGGVEVDVPMDIDQDGVHIDEGLQTLTGEQVLQLLRFRNGYYNADLGRIEVQRQVIKACMEQWLSPSRLGRAFSSLKLVENNSLSSLSTPNYLWMAKTILLNLSNFSTDTLPGTPEMRGGVSYYVLDREKVADKINESYNPYKVPISSGDLTIAG